MSCFTFPESSPITMNHHDRLTLVTLMSVLSHSKVMSIFNYVIRVVTATTCPAESLYLRLKGIYYVDLRCVYIEALKVKTPCNLRHILLILTHLIVLRK